MAEVTPRAAVRVICGGTGPAMIDDLGIECGREGTVSDLEAFCDAIRREGGSDKTVVPGAHSLTVEIKREVAPL